MKYKMTLLFLAALLMHISTNSDAEEVDVVIKNAFVVDGTGKPGYSANLYVSQGKISYIDKSKTKSMPAKQTINAENKILSPGFIDLHAHGSPITQGEFRNFISMGVSTITLGQDGSSPATTDLSDWKKDVNASNLAPNVVMFFGHGTLRRLAGIGQQSEITAHQQATMEQILTDNLPHIYGLSTGLEYSPALYAKPEELHGLAKIIGNNDKLIMSHLRNEDDPILFDSINELIAQGQYARVHVSHLKSVYGKGENRADEILQLLKNANKNGVKISADVYPYTASYTGIAILFPRWAKTKEQLVKALPQRRKELEKYLVAKVNFRNGPEATLIGTAPYKGRTLADISKTLGKPFEDVLIDDIGPQGASGAYFVMSKELQWRLMSDPMIAISSDGSPTGYHPRGYGAFAKFIEEFVVKQNRFSLEQAIHKLTLMPAKILKLKNRGEIKVGNYADLIIFDPNEVKANASYLSPHQLAQGFDFVLVNGVIVLQNGKFTTSFPGKVL